MSAPIVLTSDLTTEVVEFWGFKYKEAKEELNALKITIQKTGSEGDDVQSYGELKRMLQHHQIEVAQTIRRLEANDKLLQDVIASSRTEQKTAQEKLEASNAEKHEHLFQIGRLNTERVSLHYQIRVFHSQAESLAAEAHRQRMITINQLFNPGNTSIIENSFRPVSVVFDSPKRIVAGLQRDARQLYFLPQPPNSIPLRVASPALPGYWFYPFNLQVDTAHAPFDLVVETDTNTWQYYGRYVSRIFEGYEMKLSEWINLDDQVKSIFCNRVASQKGLNVSPINARHRYETGQWNIPCFSLQCVGYDMALHDALTATAATLKCEPEEPIPRAQSLGKRRRTDTPSSEQSAKDEGSRPMKNMRVNPDPDSVGELERAKAKE